MTIEDIQQRCVIRRDRYIADSGRMAYCFELAWNRVDGSPFSHYVPASGVQVELRIFYKSRQLYCRLNAPDKFCSYIVTQLRYARLVRKYIPDPLEGSVYNMDFSNQDEIIFFYSMGLLQEIPLKKELDV